MITMPDTVPPLTGSADQDAGRAVRDHLRAFEGQLVAAIRRKRAGRDVNELHEESLTLGQRIADKVAATMGSWPFIIVQSVLLAGWLVLNVSELIWRAWDPYPFILLNLMLSFQAAYAAPIIMMSQNRQAAKDRLQAELDLRTDLKAETLIEELHGNLETLRLQQWRELLEIQENQIQLLRNMLRRLEGNPEGGSGVP
jgi:uncharacterized membrane protein